VQDRDGAALVLGQLSGRCPRLRRVLADAGYNGPIGEWVQRTLGVAFTRVHKVPGIRGFQVLPKRWIVERTVAWLGRCPGLSKDDEQNPASGEAWIYCGMLQLMLRRLAA
jgi:putative transposase